MLASSGDSHRKMFRSAAWNAYQQGRRRAATLSATVNRRLIAASCCTGVATCTVWFLLASTVPPVYYGVLHIDREDLTSVSGVTVFSIYIAGRIEDLPTTGATAILAIPGVGSVHGMVSSIGCSRSLTRDSRSSLPSPSYCVEWEPWDSTVVDALISSLQTDTAGVSLLLCRRSSNSRPARIRGIVFCGRA